jgi:CDP-glycerol glycerophosphotransferase
MLQEVKHFIFTYLTYLIPKKKGLVLFYPTHNKKGFSGNLKSFFLYLNRCDDCADYKAVWCTNNERTFTLVRSMGFSVIKNLFLIHYYLLRAEHIIQDSSHMMLVGNLSIIQLWHGNGFKNSALLDGSNPPKKRRHLKRAYKQYAFIAASSPEHRDLMINSFENERVRIVGSPKNDVFYEDPTLAGQLKLEYALSNFDKVYAYTPTFRDTGGFEPFNPLFWENLNRYMLDNNAAFVVKKHPWDETLVIPSHYPNILDLTEEFSDVQELLLLTDVLISDYSAIVTDFAITGKPIIYYFHDYNNYTDIRSFYYDLMEVLPGPFIYNPEDLLEHIEDLSWFEEPEYQQKFQKFLATFHTYMDGNSSRRVFEEMQKLRVNA